MRIAFWGTPDIAVHALDTLQAREIVPSLIVCGLDRRRNRGMEVLPPETKVWAQKNNVPVLQPEKLRDENFLKELSKEQWDIFIVLAYGKIIPPEILSMPKHGVLNIHPSLLPLLRGPSPIQTAILQEKETGVSIMQMDEEMDHGPIVAQRVVPISPWPPKTAELEKTLAGEGATLLADILPDWIEGKITPTPQDHEKATYTHKFAKNDGLLDLQNGSPTENMAKIKAFSTTPRAHFYQNTGKGLKIRVIVTDARLTPQGGLEILRVIPEGQKELDFRAFLAKYS